LTTQRYKIIIATITFAKECNIVRTSMQKRNKLIPPGPRALREKGKFQKKSSEIVSGSHNHKMKEPKGFAGRLMLNRHIVMLVLLILVVTFLVFSRSLGNDILTGWDDGSYVTHSDVANFGQGSGASIFSNFHLGMYQPIAVLSFAYNKMIGGSSPASYILVNILLHLLNTWLVFKLMLKWLNRFEPAYIVALLFALHPMHVEGVVWISTRSSLLYSAFFLAGLIQYDKYLETAKRKHYFLTIMWAILALFSKSMAATLPLALLLVDYLRNRSFKMSVLIEKIPFFILSVIFGIIAIKASTSFGHITGLEKDFGIFERIVLVLYGVSFYLIKLVLPVNLSAIYAFPEKVDGLFPIWVYGSLIALVVAAWVIWKNKENRRIFIFGGLFFLATIGMVLPLFWSRIFITADRYTYIPYLGLFIIVAIALTRLWDGRNNLKVSTRNTVYTAVILSLLLLVSATWNRIKYWKDVPTLLNQVIDNQRSHADMAHGYFYLGNYYDALGNDEEAVKNYSLSISRNDDYLLAYNNRGIIRGKQMNMNAAIADFTKAITVNPDYAESYYNRGIAHFQQQNQVQACADWTKALQLGFKEADKVLSQYCR